MTEIVWQTEENPDAVAAAGRDAILAAADEAIAERGIFRLVLAGGTTPTECYRLLAATARDFSKWRFYFGDERCVPPGHRDRNSVMAIQAWLGPCAIPPEHIFPIPAEYGPRDGAHAYRKVVADALPFDLVLLGIGEDGHTASLFPGYFPPADVLVIGITRAPKPPAARVTLTDVVIRNARMRLVFATGASKQKAIAQWRGRGQLPIARVTEGVSTLVLMDQAAVPPRPPTGSS